MTLAQGYIQVRLGANPQGFSGIKLTLNLLPQRA